jgi:hypothetical protein
VATSAAAATQAAKDQQMRSTSNVAGATASQLNATSLSTATEGAASHSSALESPIEPQQSPQSMDLPKLDSVAADGNGSASGDASASRRGVDADVAADGGASASFDSKQDDAQK